MKILFLIPLLTIVISCNGIDSNINYIDVSSSLKDIQFYELVEESITDDTGVEIILAVPKQASVTRSWGGNSFETNNIAVFNYIKNKSGYAIIVDKLKSKNTANTTNKEYIDIASNEFIINYNGDLNQLKKIFPKTIFKEIEIVDYKGNLIINKKHFAKRIAFYVDARNEGTELENIPLTDFTFITHHNETKYTISIVRYGNYSISDMVGIANTIGGSIRFK
tara:strand:+ start:1079 stop:1744 length:666 start_codon:yes stop_codon:yes gene_type:complete